MLAVENQVFIAVISGKIANIFMGRRNFFIYLYLPVSGTEPLDKSRSLFGFLCVQRCFPEKRQCSARSHCRQLF